MYAAVGPKLAASHIIVKFYLKKYFPLTCMTMTMVDKSMDYRDKFWKLNKQCKKK